MVRVRAGGFDSIARMRANHWRLLSITASTTTITDATTTTADVTQIAITVFLVSPMIHEEMAGGHPKSAPKSLRQNRERSRGGPTHIMRSARKKNAGARS